MTEASAESLLMTVFKMTQEQASKLIEKGTGEIINPPTPTE